jgi:hypothetical protein
MRLANFSADGSELGRPVALSTRLPRSMKTVPGIWHASYSSAASRLCSGKKQLASTMRRSLAPISLASHWVETSGSMNFSCLRATRLARVHFGCRT